MSEQKDFYLWMCINKQWVGQANANLWLRFSGMDYQLVGHFHAPDEYSIKRSLTAGLYASTDHWFKWYGEVDANGVSLVDMQSTPTRDVTFGDVITVDKPGGQAFMLNRMGNGLREL
jgi:DNA repair exonuclease SbcCD nuclease subunit